MHEELFRIMYAKLCAGISEALDLLEKPENSLYAKGLLQKTLWEAEELYISWGDNSEQFSLP